eukprot:TRINITY_DN1157_c0_g1_i1.p4 TRINITY_DN1157_c0_g1~~TRINITY_DN1157_c0_g1_i1.p4  ORF type:complete len:126 (+),score=12.33 TRINITY_DN1157_c0_g1_i1:153-530(+)
MAVKTLLFVCVSLLVVGLSVGSRDLKTVIDINDVLPQFVIPGIGGGSVNIPNNFIDRFSGGNDGNGFPGSRGQRFGGFTDRFARLVRGGPGADILASTGVDSILQQIGSGELGFLSGIGTDDGNY